MRLLLILGHPIRYKNNNGKLILFEREIVLMRQELDIFSYILIYEL